MSRPLTNASAIKPNTIANHPCVKIAPARLSAKMRALSSQFNGDNQRHSAARRTSITARSTYITAMTPYPMALTERDSANNWLNTKVIPATMRPNVPNNVAKSTAPPLVAPCMGISTTPIPIVMVIKTFTPSTSKIVAKTGVVAVVTPPRISSVSPDSSI